VAFSRKLAELARDATVGLTDYDVLERTGLSFATWRRILAGGVPGEDKLLALAQGLDLDPRPFLEISTEAQDNAADPARFMQYTLERSGLPQSVKLELLRRYRQLVGMWQVRRSG